MVDDMSPRVTVIVTVTEHAPHLADLVHSLDAQTLGIGDFEVVYLVGAGTDEQVRLSRLAGRRPNVSVTTVASDPPGSQHARAHVTAVTPWQLCLEADGVERRLPPRSLERLLAVAESTGCGRVLGRSYAVGQRHQPACYPDDRVLDSVDLPLDNNTGAHVQLDAVDSDVSQPDRVALVGSYPCVTVRYDGERPTEVVDALAVTVVDAQFEWQEDSVVATVVGAVGGGDITTADLRLSASQPGTGLDFWLPTQTTIDGAGGFMARSLLTPTTAAAGEPLGSGGWELWLTVTEDSYRAVRVRVDGSLESGAVIDGRLVGKGNAGGGLLLDVDAQVLAAADVARRLVRGARDGAGKSTHHGRPRPPRLGSGSRCRGRAPGRLRPSRSARR